MVKPLFGHVVKIEAALTALAAGAAKISLRTLTAKITLKTLTVQFDLDALTALTASLALAALAALTASFALAALAALAVPFSIAATLIFLREGARSGRAEKSEVQGFQSDRRAKRDRGAQRQTFNLSES
ncbi:MAG: hypothetical protein IJM54_04330 [Thermoguttaceae bacterium]|nr:hypothetical protein [Thermoguttaceae bacterium]